MVRTFQQQVLQCALKQALVHRDAGQLARLAWCQPCLPLPLSAVVPQNSCCLVECASDEEGIVSMSGVKTLDRGGAVLALDLMQPVQHKLHDHTTYLPIEESNRPWLLHTATQFGRATKGYQGGLASRSHLRQRHEPCIETTGCRLIHGEVRHGIVARRILCGLHFRIQKGN